MLRFLPIILLCGCVHTQHNPRPSDTKFKDEDRDWVAVYREEMRIASENNDREAWHFFFYELIRERIRLEKQKKLLDSEH